MTDNDTIDTRTDDARRPADRDAGTPTEREMRTATVGESAPKATMGEFSHTNPYTGEAFGDEMVFERGPAVAADGGERNAVPRSSSERSSDGGRAGATADDEQTMEDVDHEHPDDEAAAANRVFERGKATDESGEEGSDDEAGANGEDGTV